MSYDSVTSDLNRLAKIKNFTMFERDLAANKLPQWIFITPNMSLLSLSPSPWFLGEEHKSTVDLRLTFQ